jgi:uroporphyrinogen decarboxylase
MKHRDRVLMALNHVKPDRCPMQIGFTPEFANQLRADFVLRGNTLQEPFGLESALGVDMLLTTVGWANSYYLDDKPYVDEWGVGWSVHKYETPFGAGHFTEIATHPLADEAAIPSYQPPDPHRPELYLNAEKAIHDFKSEYWIVGVTVCTIFETAWALRGLEQTMLDMVLDPDLTNEIFDIPFQYHLSAAKKLVEMGVDMIWAGDDVGAQHQMMISPRMWRKFLKPRMATLISELKAINPKVKIAYHTDGYVTPIIPELIEIGLDVLNPIQPASMDPAEVKNKYGKELCFWGTIDEQKTLPFGTPEDVASEVRHRLDTIGRDGGLIIGPTHSVQLDTPPENFWAMVDTIRNTPYA